MCLIQEDQEPSNKLGPPFCVCTDWHATRFRPMVLWRSRMISGAPVNSSTNSLRISPDQRRWLHGGVLSLQTSRRVAALDEFLRFLQANAGDSRVEFDRFKLMPCSGVSAFALA